MYIHVCIHRYIDTYLHIANVTHTHTHTHTAPANTHPEHPQDCGTPPPAPTPPHTSPPPASRVHTTPRQHRLARARAPAQTGTRGVVGRCESPPHMDCAGARAFAPAPELTARARTHAPPSSSRLETRLSRISREGQRGRQRQGNGVGRGEGREKGRQRVNWRERHAKRRLL